MKKIAPHWQILIGMILGIAVGFICVQFDGGARFVRHWIEPFGTVFINMLKMVAVPLIVVSLIKGVSDLRDMSKLSKIGGRTMGLYIVTTMIATTLGLVLVNLFSPGSGISAETREKLLSQAGDVATKKISGAMKFASEQEDASPLKFLVDIVPDNFISAMAQNTQMLQVIFFVMMFGVALVLCAPEKNPKVALVKDFFDGMNEVILKIIDIVMMLAPFGVFALLASLVASAPNSEVFVALAKYAMVVVGGLMLMVVADILLMWIFTRRSPFYFIKAILPAQLVAFSSSSSAATMPITMECATDRLGVDKEVASFVVPVGATVNMDGTALYQAVATVFIAQVFGNDLTLGAQLSIIVTATLASIGSAAVPGAGMLMLVVILQSVGVDPAGIALIFAIDRPLDMCRTVTNISGDLAVSCIVANSMDKLGEGSLEAQAIDPEDVV
jgi:proton glutamate symport protein